MKPRRDWKTALPQLLDDLQPENLYLDYKQSDALVKSNRRADDLSKDVSSFLNSDGGSLVYGVREERSPNLPDGTPMRFDPSRDGYEPGTIREDTIENIITSTIQPRPDAELYNIEQVEL